MTATDYHKVYQYNRFITRMEIAKEKLGNRCNFCGSTEQLEFDHIDPSTKLGNISTICNWSQDRFDEELAKCQLLCKSCHSYKSTLDSGNQPLNHGTPRMYRLGCRCDKCKLNNSLRRKEQRAQRKLTASS